MWLGTLFGIVFIGQVAVMLYSLFSFVRWQKKAQSLHISPDDTTDENISIVVIIARLAPYEVADIGDLIALTELGHEVLICAESPAEASVNWLCSQSNTAQTSVKLIYYDGPFGPNPKADMMGYGMSAAKNDLVVFIDGNGLANPRLDQRVLSAFDEGAALVSTLPISQSDGGYWANVERSLLTNMYARWMAAGASIGINAAFGKLLAFRRSWLDQNGGAARLNDFLAEDTALWRVAAQAGSKTHYVSPAVTTQLVRRSASDTIARAKRWHILRRADLPLVFAFESLYAFWGLMVIGLITAGYYDFDLVWTAVATTALWHGLEALVNVSTGQGWHPAQHIHAAVRDLVQCYCWWAALFNKRYSWRS